MKIDDILSHLVVMALIMLLALSPYYLIYFTSYKGITVEYLYDVNDEISYKRYIALNGIQILLLGPYIPKNFTFYDLSNRTHQYYNYWRTVLRFVEYNGSKIAITLLSNYTGNYFDELVIFFNTYSPKVYIKPLTPLQCNITTWRAINWTLFVGQNVSSIYNPSKVLYKVMLYLERCYYGCEYVTGIYLVPNFLLENYKSYDFLWYLFLGKALNGTHAMKYTIIATPNARILNITCYIHRYVFA